MKKWLLLLLLPFQLLAFEFREEINKAMAGDFIVYSYKQSVLLLRIAKVTDRSLFVEEISYPLSMKGKMPLQEWLDRSAPSHTSWTLTEINKDSGKIKSIFSVDDDQFISSNPAFQFLPTLFQLQFRPIAPSERKMVGPEPSGDERDVRKVWLPKIIFNEKEVTAPVDVLRVTWPQDESELSGKPLDLYFATSGALLYLPYWIEVHGGLGKARISTLDSGNHLRSPVDTNFFVLQKNQADPNVPKK